MEGLHNFQVPLSPVPITALTDPQTVGIALVLGDISLFLSKLSWNWQSDVETDSTQLLLPVLWDR